MRRSAAVAAAAAITGVMAVTGPVAASEAAAVPPTVVGTASGGAASTWRVAYTDSALMSGFGDVAAFSGTNIWVAGGVTPEGAPNGTPDIRRWNGKSWATVRLPSKFAASDITRMSASSAGDVWIFGQVRSSTGQNPLTFGLRWNGSVWSQPLSWLTYNTVDAATVIGPKDVWVFGSVGTWHYNGTAWKRYPLPYTIAGASAISSTDIWAAADSSSGSPVLAHWNGTAWGTKPLPKISSSPPGAGILDVVASSDANIWAVGSTVSSTGAFVSLALHWASGVWHQVDPAGNLQLGQVIADGAGGVWAAGSPSYGNSAVFHYSAGKWTTVAMPTVSGKFTSISALSRVQGTTTLYGAGMLVFGGLPETEGLIVHN